MADDDKRKTPPVAAPPDDPDAPPSAEEIAESERLRRALDDPRSTHEDAKLARALKRTVDPRALDDEEHRALLDRVLSEDDAAPTPEEIAESERLREELDDPGSQHPDVLLARSLRHAVAPKPIEAATHRKILDRVLPESRPRRVQTFVLASVFAAAAAIALAIIPLRKGDESSIGPDVSAGLVHVHAADDLFAEPFPKEQLTSARIDRIASARTRDLRSNRFAKWGVR